MSRNVIGAASIVQAAILIGRKHRVATTSLMMVRNRLANEKSSYLLQHANNPIDWYPWSEEAFNQAKATNRPIFLSIGYSTCHWCHVMAHESFENEEIAKILNDNFISIKVDREERPDVDRVYMSFVQTISNGGGWPLNVFLTPDLKPITGGTYFPPRDMYDRLGFKTILNVVTEKWRTNGKEIVEAAEEFVNVMKQSMKPRRDQLPPLEQVEKLCYNHFKDEFDESYKGFGSGPKFPDCVHLDFLLSFYCTNPCSKTGENALRMVGETLLAMDRGGIHDHIGKGFHRYAVDSKWHVPHFEKMLYDQAQLLAVYSDYYRITGKFKNVIEDIADYVQTNLSHESGGFCSAEDADSLPSFGSVKKCEGAYYLWMEKDIDEILKDKPPLDEALGLTYANIFKMFYNVKPNGNIPSYADPYDELKTQNILVVKESLETFAKKCSLSTEKLENIIDEAKSALREAQKKRPRPHLDNKLLTSWNGLMISGLAKAAVALQNEEFLRRAQQIVDFLKKFLLVDDHMLRAAYLGSDGKIVENDNPVHAYADDYTYVIQGLLDLYEASFDEQLIKLATELQMQMDEQFWDVEYNSGYHQTVKGPHIIFRIMDDQDASEPSRNSVASVNLMRLYSITNQMVYRDRAQQILENAAERLRKYPFILTKMISGLQRYRCPPKQVIVLGSRSNRTTKEMLSLISKNFDCHRTLISMDPEEDLWLQSINNHLKQLALSAPKISTVYICDNFACTMPITSLDELKAKFDSKKLPEGST